MARELVARAALAVTQLETIDREAAAQRELAMTEARTALAQAAAPPPAAAVAAASVAPAPAASMPMPAMKSSRPPRVVPSVKPQPRSSAAPERPNPTSAVPERPSSVPDDYQTVSESEVSFASIAPPPSQQLAAVAPFMRQSVRPSGRPTPPRSEVVPPASVRPPAGSPLSDPEIRISIDEEEPQ
jgi:hypothetical protein